MSIGLDLSADMDCEAQAGGMMLTEIHGPDTCSGADIEDIVEMSADWGDDQLVIQRQVKHLML